MYGSCWCHLVQEEKGGQLDAEDIKELFLHCGVQDSALHSWVSHLLSVFRPLSQGTM